MKHLFRRMAEITAQAAGSPWAFALMVILTLVWLALGPVLKYSDTWQLTMNTFASQVTFLIAFLLQNSQNRDTRAVHLKLDEVLRSLESARPGLIRLETLSDEELEHLEGEFMRLREQRGSAANQGPSLARQE
jgi:low affinity Fe/Cu permease